MPYRECQSRKQLITNWVRLTVGYANHNAIVFKMFSDGTNNNERLALISFWPDPHKHQIYKSPHVMRS